MLISELPQPYKSLAEKRREECIKEYNVTFSDELPFAFFWKPSEAKLWLRCHKAQTESELPKFPYDYIYVKGLEECVIKTDNFIIGFGGEKSILTHE